MAIKNWANDSRFKSMRSRGRCNSIEMYVSIGKGIGWWEVIRNTEPTKPNCEYWDGVRSEFEVAATKGSVNYRDYFPNGRHSKKAAHLQGDDKTIAQWLDLYVTNMDAVRKKPHSTNTKICNERIVRNQLKPNFGEKYLSQLKFIDVCNWIEFQEVVQSTVENKLAPLRWCYNKATKKGLIDHNIFQNGYPEAKNESLHEKNAFKPEELKSILNQDMPIHIKNMIVFWFYTGLRTGEIAGLTWKKWDKQNNTILIDEVRRDNKQERGTKTQAGVRKFTLSPQATKILQRQEKITKFGVETNVDNSVFLDESNRAWTYDFYKVWTEILNDAGVEYRRPYNIRHTFATMKLSYEGIDQINNLSYVLGHDEVKTTKKSYVDYELVNLDWSEIYNMVV